MSKLSRLEIIVISIVLLAVVFFLVDITGEDNTPIDSPTVSVEEPTKEQESGLELVFADEIEIEAEPEPVDEASPVIVETSEQDVETESIDRFNSYNEADEAIQGAPEPDYSAQIPTDLPPLLPQDDVPPYGGTDIQTPDESFENFNDSANASIDIINERVIEGDPLSTEPTTHQNLPVIAPQDDVPPQ